MQQVRFRRSEAAAGADKRRLLALEPSLPLQTFIGLQGLEPVPLRQRNGLADVG